MIHPSPVPHTHSRAEHSRLRVHTSVAFFSACSSFSWASFRASEYLSSSSSVPFNFFCRATSSSSTFQEKRKGFGHAATETWLKLLPVSFHITEPQHTQGLQCLPGSGSQGGWLKPCCPYGSIRCHWAQDVAQYRTWHHPLYTSFLFWTPQHPAKFCSVLYSVLKLHPCAHCDRTTHGLLGNSDCGTVIRKEGRPFLLQLCTSQPQRAALPTAVCRGRRTAPKHPNLHHSCSNPASKVPSVPHHINPYCALHRTIYNLQGERLMTKCLTLPRNLHYQELLLIRVRLQPICSRLPFAIQSSSVRRENWFNHLTLLSPKFRLPKQFTQNSLCFSMCMFFTLASRTALPAFLAASCSSTPLHCCTFIQSNHSVRELNTLPWMLQQGTAGRRSGASFVYDIKILTTVCVSVLKI